MSQEIEAYTGRMDDIKRLLVLVLQELQIIRKEIVKHGKRTNSQTRKRISTARVLRSTKTQGAKT